MELVTCPSHYPDEEDPDKEELLSCGLEQPLQDTIMHLNDQHQWTREQIADWLETLDLDIRFTVPERVAL